MLKCNFIPTDLLLLSRVGSVLKSHQDYYYFLNICPSLLCDEFSHDPKLQTGPFRMKISENLLPEVPKLFSAKDCSRFERKWKFNTSKPTTAFQA